MPSDRLETLARPGPESPRQARRCRLLSVVVPVYNESENIGQLVQRLAAATSGLECPCEIIVVDDGSRDDTWAALARTAEAHPQVAGLRLSRNFGHQHALLAGLAHAAGDAVVSLDGDLQHPPELIPDLLAAWAAGYDVVNTQRRDREVTHAAKRWSSKYFYWLFSALSGVTVAEGSSDFRLLDRRVVEALLGFQDTHLFLRGAVQWLGFPATVVAFDVEPRHAGTSKYSFRRMLRFAATAIVAFSTKPLRIGIWIGVVTSVLAFAELVYIVVQYLRGMTFPGWASTVGVVSLLFGILFILLGIIGTYLAAIHAALQNRPRFVVAERWPAAAEEEAEGGGPGVSTFLTGRGQPHAQPSRRRRQPHESTG